LVGIRGFGGLSRPSGLRVDPGKGILDEEDTMADEGMVALREALGKIMESEHADLLREGVALVVREVMEMEASERAGAERHSNGMDS
jgi:hypothetical protein